jgi:hypothetical protein
LAWLDAVWIRNLATSDMGDDDPETTFGYVVESSPNIGSFIYTP